MKPILFMVFAFLTTSACSTDPTGACRKTPLLTWENITSKTVPPARFDHSMVLAKSKRKVFVFGGRSKQGVLLNDLWEFDRSTTSWSRIDAGSGPSPRSGASLDFHEPSGRLILFGGYRYNLQGEALFLKELWFFEPSAGWTRKYFAKGPMGRAWHATGIDTNRLIIVGGYAGKPDYYLDDVWSYEIESSRFKRLDRSEGPSRLGISDILFVKEKQELLLFAERAQTKSNSLDIWRFHLKDGTWSKPSSSPKLEKKVSHIFADNLNRSFIVLKGPTDTEKNWNISTCAAESDVCCNAIIQAGPTRSVGLECVADPDFQSSWICFGGAQRDQVSQQTWLLHR